MWTFPVFLDCRPRFVHRVQDASLLLAPLGESTVLHHLLARLRVVSDAPPLVVTEFEFGRAYEDAIADACPEVECVHTLPAFTDRLHEYEPSDRLLFADPRCFPLDASDPAIARLVEDGDPRCVKHLLALGQRVEGTRELVDADSWGRVRAIQRYYESVTWPLAAGVAATLVPVSCLRVTFELALGSLPRLRRVLASEGMPGRDLALESGAVNLGVEQGLLAMNERLALELVHRAPWRRAVSVSPRTGRGARVHPSATIVGPVVLQAEVDVAEGATVIGPTVVGAGARVGPGATVAQCVIGSRQVVTPGVTLRQRVLFGDPGALEPSHGPGEPEPPDAWEEPAFRLSRETSRASLYPALKRALDLTAAGLGLVLLAPLGLLVAALIKLESKGSVHYGHLREGRGGRVFRCWKYRTMVIGADVQQRTLARNNEVDGPQFKMDQDPRRTRVGRALTATNLDELPQLWNVLLGEMSLVGPRPSPFRENQICIPWREGRLSVRPGITGLWQVCRSDRDRGDFHQWIYYDLLYVRHMSVWLDLKILAFTVLGLAWGRAIPLSWLLAPQLYGERRSSARRADPPRLAVAAGRASPAGRPAAARRGLPIALVSLRRLVGGRRPLDVVQPARLQRGAAHQRDAVHVPDEQVAREAVVPQDVGVAVLVEVRDPRDPPAEVGEP